MSIDTSGLLERVEMINFLVGGWQAYGYENPPTSDCKAIPPIGERYADEVRAGHQAVDEIDQLTRDLYRLRDQLVTELRQNEDIAAARVDAMLAERDEAGQ